ncbi:MAG TPA: type II toxin-antitoxin system RelE/ParE family toxin [Pirellulales bacterium]|jgi:plasmid stabilization system protein ParE|nr:type II toxin-antitoxin system RelE/ParE family toxin [Pirellulales bacterium]
MILRILAEAEAEIDAARRYLNEQSPDLGGRFLDDLTQRLNDIATAPIRFAKLETLPDNQPYRRALLKAFRYAVVYEVLPDEIVVTAVAHASREPNYWLGRR